MSALWDRLRDPRVVRGALVGLAVLVGVALLGAGGWAWYRAGETRSFQAFADTATLVQRAQDPAATPRTAIAPSGRSMASSPSTPVVAGAPGRLSSGQPPVRGRPVRPGPGGVRAGPGQGGLGRGPGADRAAIGYTWEAEKQYGKADAAFQAALRSLGPRDFLYEELLTDLARVQDSAGNPKAAIETTGACSVTSPTAAEPTTSGAVSPRSRAGSPLSRPLPAAESGRRGVNPPLARSPRPHQECPPNPAAAARPLSLGPRRFPQCLIRSIMSN